jgi:hypothetical protein
VRLASILLAVLLASGNAQGQAPAAPATTPTPTPTRPDLPEAPDGEQTWTFSVSTYAYIVENDRDYVQPTLTADRDWLHLEARYNYEALNSASAWVGYNFSGGGGGGGGEKLAWEFTPMIGGVFGDTNGVAPGYKASLSWWKIELYSEG